MLKLTAHEYNREKRDPAPSSMLLQDSLLLMRTQSQSGGMGREEQMRVRRARASQIGIQQCLKVKEPVPSSMPALGCHEAAKTFARRSSPRAANA